MAPFRSGLVSCFVRSAGLPLPPEPGALARMTRDDRVLIPLVTPHHRAGIGSFATIFVCSTPEG